MPVNRGAMPHSTKGPSMTLLDELMPIGFTLGGKPVYPMRGGAPVGEGEEVGKNGPPANAQEQGDDDDDEPDDDDSQGDPDDDDDDSDDDDDKKLGDAGKKALEETRKERERFKVKAREARDALKPWSDLEKEFGLKPADVRARLQGKVKDAEGKEVDVAELRRSIESEVRGSFTQQLAGAQVQAIATEFLADADLAVKFLDLSDFDTDDKGNVDKDDVRAALKELVAERPYLGKTETSPGRPRRPSGGKGQGSGKGGDPKKSAGSVAAGMELWKQTGTKSKV